MFFIESLILAVNTFTFHHKSLPLCFLLPNLFSNSFFLDSYIRKVSFVGSLEARKLLKQSMHCREILFP